METRESAALPRERPEHVGYVLRKFPVLSETFILNEILGLEARGARVEIFSLAPPRDPRFHEELAKLRAPVWYVPGISDLKTLLKYNLAAAKRYRGKYLRTLFYVVSKGRPGLFWRFLQSGYVAERAAPLRLQHLHAHFATRATTVAQLTAMISRIPYSFTAHAFDIYSSRVRSKVLQEKIDRATFVVTISETNKSYLKNIANGSGKEIFLVHNGINLARFMPNGAAPKSPFTMLCVARLIEKKGIAFLIEACRHLRDRGVPFRCWIVGKGRLRPQLQDLIIRWSLSEQVRLLGSRKQGDVLKRYRSADLFALPCIVDSNGNREGLPVSIVEALACGLPVVTTSITGIPEVIHHRHNGLFVPQRDPKALADAIELLITDTRLYESLRANARESVLPTFDLRATSKTLHQLFVEGHP